jgi:hypothetical protein
MRTKRRLGPWIILAVLGIHCFSLRWAQAAWVGQRAPELSNQVWINSAPLRLANLRGKVILLEFWTYG